MTDSRYFCIRPFTHLQIEPNGEAKICCIATDVVRDGGRRMNLQVDSLDEIWRSTALTEIRRALIADEPVRECERCNNYQAGSSGDLRDVVNAEWDSRVSLESTVAALRAAPGRPLGPQPNEYQLNLSTLCNLKCRMCGTRYSSRIAEDPVFSRWADDYHAESAVVGRWRGDKLALLPRYVLGTKYTGFGNGLWARDGRFHRDLIGPATIALPRVADFAPSALELTISTLNQPSSWPIPRRSST
ncbi:MAG: SPASM domain-containing protein [Proteobacteria bacterium]|nr:SPASM domain-containing protein [Pseudomonadota bacterium]